MAASQKLSHLLQLADQGPVLRAALAEEVADLLAAWPSDCPESMRIVCEALLAKTAHDVDGTTCAMLRKKLAGHPDLSNRLLPREAGLQALIEAARKGDNLAVALAKSLGVDAEQAARILSDDSGAVLAAVCKDAGVDRAAFSAMALLLWPQRDRSHAFAVLDAFDKAA